MTISTITPLAVGDALFVAMAYDNSGSAGVDPLTAFAVTPAAGAMTSTSVQTGLNDPGVIQAGLAVRANAYTVTNAIPLGTAISISWTGTLLVRAVATIKVSSNSNGAVSYRTNSGAAGTNVVASAAPALTTPSVTSGELVLCWAGHENGAAIVGDADTTSGTWSTISTTFNGTGATGMAVGVQTKTVTATATQAFNPTGTSSDWILGALIFTEVSPPAVTQASYRFYADGTEAGATALAAQDTAATVDVGSGNANLVLRARLQSTTAVAPAAVDDWQLQYEKNANGTWVNVAAEVLESYEAIAGASSTTLTGLGDALCQSVMGNDLKLSRLALFAFKVGVPPGNITAVLYAHTGTFGSGGLGTGSPLATSTARLGTSLQTTANWESFSFDGTFTLVNGTPYVIGITTNAATTATDAATVYFSAAPPTPPGNIANLIGGTWFSSANDRLYQMYTVGAVVPFNSANLTDAAATTNRLGAGTGAFVAGKVSEDGLADDVGWTANNYTELLYSFTLTAAQLASGDTLRFRVLRNGVVSVMTYTQTPTINVTKTAVVPASVRRPIPSRGAYINATSY